MYVCMYVYLDHLDYVIMISCMKKKTKHGNLLDLVKQARMGRSYS